MYGIAKNVCVVPVVPVGGQMLLSYVCLYFCMSDVISSFRSLIAGSQVFALLMFFVRFCILCLRLRACNCYAYCPLVCCACLPSV